MGSHKWDWHRAVLRGSSWGMEHGKSQMELAKGRLGIANGVCESHQRKT